MRITHTDPKVEMIVDFNWCQGTDRFIHKTVRLGSAESHSTISRWDWDNELTSRLANGWQVEFWDMVHTDRNAMSGAC